MTEQENQSGYYDKSVIWTLLQHPHNFTENKSQYLTTHNFKIRIIVSENLN